jgi:hypothetical protein
METRSSIGAEFEMPLIYKIGDIANDAHKILNDPRGRPWLVYEGTNSQVEINSDPYFSVKEIAKDLIQKKQTLEKICEDYNNNPENEPVYPLAVSEFGAGRGKRNENIGRLWGYLSVLGEKRLDELITNSGTHLHILKDDDNTLNQYNLLHAMDALSFVITSTSPITHNGTNNLNCHRINTTRYRVFKDYSLNAQLQDYPQKLSEIKERTNQTYEHWFKKATEKGMTENEFKHFFKPENTGFAPIRDRPKFGTWEVRSFDTAPLDIALGAIALYKGLNDYFLNNNVELEISEKNQEFKFTENKFILPNYNTLIQMEQEAIHNGLKGSKEKGESIVFDYLKTILPFAKLGLTKEDIIYLEPIEKLIKTRLNLADKIMNYLKSEQNYKSGNKVNLQQARAANLFMRDRYLLGIENTVNRTYHQDQKEKIGDSFN